METLATNCEHFGRAEPIYLDPERRSYREQHVQLPISGDLYQDICVRLAHSDHERDSASTLINRRYGWRGYGENHKLVARATNMTFTASIEDEVVGTITLGVDSDAGLAADETFREEINTFRRVPGAKLCELTKLAFDAELPSKPLLAALFHIVFIYGHHEHACTDLFIEVNPRHRRFYQAMLGFQPIGELKSNRSVGAPSQLMWLKTADIRAHIDTQAGIADRERSRSLYPFFFSPREEAGIVERLVKASDGAPRIVPSRDPRAGGQPHSNAFQRLWGVNMIGPPLSGSASRSQSTSSTACHKSSPATSPDLMC